MLDKWRLGRENEKPKEKEIVEVEITEELLKKYLGKSQDVVFSKLRIGETTALLCCIDGLVADENIGLNVLNTFFAMESFKTCESQEAVVSLLEEGNINLPSQKCVDTLGDLISDILFSNFAVVFEDVGKAYIFDAKGFNFRGIAEPANEAVLKGSKDGFIEALRINTSIIRRHIRSHNLIITQHDVGRQSKTNIAVVYMENLADERIVQEVENLLKSLDTDSIVSPGQIEEQLSSKKNSLFPQVLYTERCDKFAANIMDGRIGVLIDGFPTAFIVPVSFPVFFQTPEDYSANHIYGSFVRLIRYICLALAILTPALYIAIITFHTEMIPSRLAKSIMSAKTDVPLTSFLEILFMLIAFEILIEAGVRLPQAMGQTVSIVAGLIIGDAAITAKFVSPAVVVVIAIAGIASFTIPYQDMANPIRLLRLLFIVGAEAAGLFGVSIVFIGFMYYLCSLETFGIPYLLPFAASNGKGLKRDTIFRPKFGGKHEKV